jgi:hypothetical protein
MPSDGLDRLVIEMARVSDQSTDDVVCVLEAIENLLCEGELRSLPQLGAFALALCVDVLHPAVVLLGVAVLDVLLENNHVRVRQWLSMCRRQDGGSVVVDSGHLQHRRRGGERR